MKGWFSPIKGAYPSLQQIDRTLLVDGTATPENIHRGSLIAVVNGKFKLATNADEGELYFALQDYMDSQADMAGQTNYNGGSHKVFTKADKETDDALGEGALHKDLNIGQYLASYDEDFAGQPAITGLSLRMPGEYQTNQFDGTPEVGDKLTVENGKLKKVTASEAVVAVVTKAPFRRWINDFDTNSKPTGTGNSTNVIQFITAL